jgi:hypothetical protein
MARYSRRDRPDYSHLQGRTPDQVFAETYAKGAPGEHSGYYPERVNLALLRLFDERETLGQDEANAVYGALFAKPAHTLEYTADRAASLLAWGIRLGILTEAEEGGRLAWRLRERELMWETDKRGRARQIRGLPDAAQAAMNRRRETQARAAATRQRAAAAANAPRIKRAVDSLLIIRPDYVAPEHPMWREALPNALLPATLAELRPMLLDAHHAMDPRGQQRWLHSLETMCSVLRLTGSVDRGSPPGERGTPLPLNRPPAPAHVPDLAPMDPDDDAALEGL